MNRKKTCKETPGILTALKERFTIECLPGSNSERIVQVQIFPAIIEFSSRCRPLESPYWLMYNHERETIIVPFIQRWRSLGGSHFFILIVLYYNDSRDNFLYTVKSVRNYTHFFNSARENVIADCLERFFKFKSREKISLRQSLYVVALNHANST